MEITFKSNKLLDGAKKIAKGDTVSSNRNISSDKRQGNYGPLIRWKN